MSIQLPPAEELEGQITRPVVFRLGAGMFRPDRSVLMFRNGRPQKLFERVRSIATSQLYKEGTVCLVGFGPKDARWYKDQLGRRRAEAVHAALAGDAALAKTITERLLTTETFERYHDRWMNVDADHFLAIISAAEQEGAGPSEPGSADAAVERIRQFQAESGIWVTGLAAKETLLEVADAYASAISLASFAIPRRIYGTQAAAGPSGLVEIWVFPEPTPPNGTVRGWKRNLEPILIDVAKEDESTPTSIPGAKRKVEEPAPPPTPAPAP